MSKILTIAAVSFVSACVFAGETDKSDAEKIAAKKQRDQEILQSTGGRVLKPNTGKGWVAIVDLQKECPTTEIQRGIKKIVAYTSCSANYCKGSDDLAKKPLLQLGEAALKETGANIALLLVDLEGLPPMLVAPEARWGVVNVRALKSNLPAGDLGRIAFEGRCRKETMRAFSILCGGSGSQYVGTVVNAAAPEELDKLDEAIPLDNVLAYDNFIRKIGMTKRIMTTYRNACRQGWAPAPTNDYQKAIWDEFHALPTKPMIIEPESKKSK